MTTRVPVFASHDDELDQPSLPLTQTPGLGEWLALLDALTPDQHRLNVHEIAEVEAFRAYQDTGFTSAGFVVRLHDGRRLHLQCAIDGDSGSDAAAVTVEPMRDGVRLPFTPAADDPTGPWSAETDLLDEALFHRSRPAGTA